MKYIDIESLNKRLPEIKADYQSKQPFRYVMFENFFPEDVANEILAAYPKIDNGQWDGTTYLDQKNKFSKTEFEKDSILDVVFKEFNSPTFTQWLDKLSDIEEPLLGDDELFGGGLHQSISGAFLNVHVDYNFHPTTKYHRRLNVLVYMNKDWKDEYEGHIELWDIDGNKKKQLGKFAPTFNRCLIFETNEISYHGHPTPLNTPEGMNRKSLATYFYTTNRPAHELGKDHNTVYVNTGGVSGKLKRIKSGFKALIERITG